MTVGDVGQGGLDLQEAGRHSVAVARRTQRLKHARNADLSYQIRGKDHRPLQNDQHDQFLASEVFVDTRCQARYDLIDLVAVDVRPKRAVMDANDV